MAFPVPKHLPRYAYSAHDHSFSSSSTHSDGILRKVSEASWDTLDSGLSSSWVEELSNEINDTRATIRGLVNKNLPDFERQLLSSQDIQDRVRSLSAEAERLTSSLHDPQIGLLPALTKRYAQHTALAQDAQDANILYITASYTLRCRDDLSSLTALVADAKLAESVAVSSALGRLLQDAPDPLPKSKIFSEFKHKYRVLSDTVQEQLGEAYSRSVRVEQVSDGDQIIVTSPVPILQSSRKINLAEIFGSLMEDSLVQSLRTLQKLILAKFIEPILSDNSTAVVDGSCLTICPHPASNPIGSLSVVMNFVQERIFAFVPPAHLAKTMAAFYQPLASSLLNFFRRTMPDSLPALPAYLQVVKGAVEFERSLVRLGISAGQHQVVAEWADSVQTHYEKRRRENILEAARRILSDEQKLAGARVENDVPADDPWGAGDTPVDDPWDDGWDEPFTSDSSQSSSASGSTPVAKTTTPRPPPITLPPEPKIKETYLVSECAKSILKLIQDTVKERREQMLSGIFSEKTQLNPPAATSVPILVSAIPSVFDLFRALYAVSHASKMASSPALRIRLSNDCKYLSSEAERLSSDIAGDVASATKLLESRERLDSLGERCFDDCLEEQNNEVLEILRKGEGFTALSHDNRYAVCQSAVETAMRKISSIGQDWKITLAQSSYLEAMGFIVDETLSFVLNDILALPNIPEVDSHRLNQLCLKLESLKDLFVTSPGTESTVGTHVGSWFKFAYMAELLEASLADISYLFESGALIDFEVDELVRLVRGLFAETPLRSKTIDKIHMGHPRADTGP